MPIANLSRTSSNSNSHTSTKVKDEYDAKHEAGVAGKMANVWETKTATLDGGKLPETFGKDPKQITAEKKAKSPANKETPHVDAGPNQQQGQGVTKQKSVVEMKNAFESMAEKEKRENDRREMEKKMKDDNVALARAKSAALEEEKSNVLGAMHTLETQARELMESITKLKRELKL